MSLPSVIASCVVRSANPGKMHGALYKVDFETEKVKLLVSYGQQICFGGRGKERGMRGIAIDNERKHVYCATNKFIIKFDQTFAVIKQFNNYWLSGTHEIFLYEDMLFVVSTSFDVILQFDIKKEKWILGRQFRINKEDMNVVVFDPNKKGNVLNRTSHLHLNSIYVDYRGMFVYGTKLSKMLWCNWKNKIEYSLAIPFIAHNVRPFRDGVLLNNTPSNRVEYIRHRKRTRKFKNAKIPTGLIKNIDTPDRVARVGFARGLCYQNGLLCSGSTPANISLFNFRKKALLRNVVINYDKKFTIHGLEFLNV